MASTSTPTEPQAGDALPRTTDEIKQSCKRFRVLVLGKEGVGKSSLINHIFKVDIAKVSEYTPGEAEIDKEIFSESNDSLVLHDSRGYGSGETENFRKLTEFIGRRTGNDNVGDRLHAIWLCIATPFAGGRVLEAGDEEIFRLVHGKVPIIVVFTRYDYLVNTKERELRNSGIQRTEGEIRSLVKTSADRFFDEHCLTPVKKVNASVPCVRVSVKPRYEETLRNLVKTTLHHINPGEYPLPQVESIEHSKPPKHVSGFLSFFSPKSSKKEAANYEPVNPVGVMFAMAQRIDVDANIQASVSVGHKKYWRGLASGANFFGKNLQLCLEVIHDDIVVIWNFPRLSMLCHDNFRGKISQLVAGLAEPQGPSPTARILPNITSIAGAAGAIFALGVGSANPAGFIVGPIVAGAVFAKWVYDIYSATPGVLRCFMAYIVDLIIIMQMIFVISEARPDGVVKPEEVEDVLNRFKANQCDDVHQEIRRFIRKTGVLKAVTSKDIIFEKIVNLIDHHRLRADDSTRVEMPA